MEQNQQQSQQWQGPERRQSLGPHQGEERRKSALSAQERKDDQQERTRQQALDQTDTH